MNDALLSSETTEWTTPRSLFDAQARRWGPFWLDVAATASNALAPFWFDQERDALARSWAHPGRKLVSPAHGRNAWGNYPYTRGEEVCRPNCKRKTCEKRGAHALQRVPSLGEWVAKGRDEALSWTHGGAMVTLLPERPDTEWWADAIRRQPSSAGAYLGGMACPNGGPAARFFPEEYPAAEWREYRWERLTVDVVLVEGRVHFGGTADADAGAPFPSAVVTFYRPGFWPEL